MPLFTELRACNFGVISITHPHKEFLNELTKIKTQYIIKLEWNTLLIIVVQDVLCLAWQDNNIVLALSNIHTIDKAEDFREKVRRRPVKTSINRRIIRHIFADELIKSLSIPCFIDDYNQYMGGVDLANQFRESYETHRPTFKTWWPLFYWLIDVACVNAYRLHQLHVQKPLTHLQFRTLLYYKLLGYSERAKIQQLQVNLGGKRVFNPDLQHLHYWEKRAKRGTCAWCSYQLKYKRVLGKGVKGIAKRSVGGCVFCNVPLCQEGECWTRFHSNNVDC